MICIGGSNGKTTTKDLTAAVLSEKYNVLKTEGNLNNHLGLPMTLLNLNKSHDCLLYTSDAADERSSVDLGVPRIIKKIKKTKNKKQHKKKKK